MFWTTEIHADDAAFAAHRASDVHAATAPVFTELIATADVIIGENLRRIAATSSTHPGAASAAQARGPRRGRGRTRRYRGSA